MVPFKALALGHAADDTFRYLIIQARVRGIQVDAIDLVHLSLRGDVSIEPSDPMQSSIKIGKREYHLRDYKAILGRFLDVSSGTSDPRLQEKYSDTLMRVQHIVGTAHMEHMIRAVNPPCVDGSNFAKLYHTLLMGRWTGFRIPPSCLSNDPNELKHFFEQHIDHGIIAKGASSQKTWAVNVELADLSRLDSVRGCPVLLQRRIIGADLRVHVVGDELFGEHIFSTEVDYRRPMVNSRYSRAEISEELRAGCLSVRQHLGLPFVGIDFKIESGTNRHFILEANAMPCYQGYDRRAQGAISDAIARYILSRESESRNYNA